MNPLAAVRAHPLVSVVSVIFCLALGLAAGLVRQPVYTAESRLGVGEVDLSSTALPGYVTAAQDLAVAYSRTIHADQVVQATARNLRRPTSDIASETSASPIPGSQVMSVQATGSSEAEALSLARTLTNNFLRYLQQINGTGPSQQQLLAEYRSATYAARSASEDVKKARDGVPAASASRLRDLQAASDVASLRARSLAARYQAETEDPSTGGDVRLLSNAVAATSDRTDRLEFSGLVGLFVGLLAAAALATWTASRRRPSWLPEGAGG